MEPATHAASAFVALRIERVQPPGRDGSEECLTAAYRDRVDHVYSSGYVDSPNNTEHGGQRRVVAALLRSQQATLIREPGNSDHMAPATTHQTS